MVGSVLGGTVVGGAVVAGGGTALWLGRALSAAGDDGRGEDVAAGARRGAVARVGPGAGVVGLAVARAAAGVVGFAVVGAGAGAAGGAGVSQGRCVDSTRGSTFSGRTGPPAKLTPTSAVYASPASPATYAIRRSRVPRRPLGSTKTGGRSGTAARRTVGPSVTVDATTVGPSVTESGTAEPPVTGRTTAGCSGEDEGGARGRGSVTSGESRSEET